LDGFPMIFISFPCEKVEEDVSNMLTSFVEYKKIVYSVVWSNGITI
jgi:hypothetical protein